MTDDIEAKVIEYTEELRKYWNLTPAPYRIEHDFFFKAIARFRAETEHHIEELERKIEELKEKVADQDDPEAESLVESELREQWKEEEKLKAEMDSRKASGRDC